MLDWIIFEVIWLPQSISQFIKTKILMEELCLILNKSFESIIMKELGTYRSIGWSSRMRIGDKTLYFPITYIQTTWGLGIFKDFAYDHFYCFSVVIWIPNNCHHSFRQCCLFWFLWNLNESSTLIFELLYEWAAFS